jgi:hypothetical protein
MNNTILAIKLNIITISPTNVSLSVKKTRHHKIFKTPFTISHATMFFEILLLLIQILKTIPNNI